MKALKPEDCDRLIELAIRNKDLEAALDLYEPGASFVIDSGEAVSGKEGLKDIIQGMFQMEDMRFVSDVRAILNAEGDIALTFSAWVGVVKGEDGTRKEVGGKNVEVVRRQADGTWKFVIDHPRGAN